MIQERVRAGLARARVEGKRLGRPPIAPELERRIRDALAKPGRPGVRKIAERSGVDPATVQRISAPFRERKRTGRSRQAPQAVIFGTLINRRYARCVTAVCCKKGPARMNAHAGPASLILRLQAEGQRPAIGGYPREVH